MRMNALTVVTLILTLIGALNWGLVGFFGYNIVAELLGSMTPAARIVYAIIGIAAVVLAIAAFTSRSHEPAVSVTNANRRNA